MIKFTQLIIFFSACGLSILPGYSQSIDAGGRHALKLCPGGSVISWGSNDHGQLGNDTTIGDGPLTVHNISNAIAVSAGYRHSMALLANGTVWTWGYNYDGQLGNGSYLDNYTPSQISSLSNVIKISAGGSHSIALKSNGTVWAWGANNWGQLGNGNSVGVNTPVTCSNLTNIIDICAGDNFCLALKNNGTVWAWGYNSDWELGDSLIGISSNLPIQVTGLSNVLKIAAGRNFSMALKNDNTVWTWGYDGNSMLGNGAPYLNQYTPTQVPGLNGAVAISGGYSHALVLKSDSTVWAWGLNGSGELGTWNFSQSDVPSNVHYLQPLGSIVAISAGSEFSLAMDLSGNVWSWGANAVGQLANANYTNSNIPLLSEVTCSSSGVDNLKEDWSYTIYPNPSDGKFQLQLSSLSLDKYRFEIYNALGDKVYEVENISRKEKSEIDISGLSKGIYISKLYNGSSLSSKIIAIQ